jgi:seryl-tRNA synthetase
MDGGVAGVYHRSATFETVIRQLEAYVSAAGRDQGAQQVFIPPVIALSTLVRAGYVSSFPNLMGTINSFSGDESQLSKILDRADSGGDWAEMMSPTDVSLGSATCHSVYPMLEGATIPEGGLVYEVQAYCFRHEPSVDPARMQSFRMHEFARIGTAREALDHRAMWIERGRGLLDDLGLTTDVVEANDPFFGRAGKMLAAGQLEKALKYEIVAPISSEKPGAISSGNYHEDHFGVPYSITAHDGSVAHSACFAFGLDRIALSLFYRHGLDIETWPTDVSERLSSGYADRLR